MKKEFKMVSYKTQPQRIVVLLSSIRDTTEVDNNEDSATFRTLDIFLFEIIYNIFLFKYKIS